MRTAEYGDRIEAAKLRAHGRWGEILAACGVGDAILSRRNGPCPLCGGTDRFQYTDKFGEGNYHCRQCGPGGGFKLLQAVRGLEFHAALCEVERCVGVMPASRSNAASSGHPRTTAAPVTNDAIADRMRSLVQRIWEEAQPVVPGDEVDRYLRQRGLALNQFPPVLRCHPSLGYYEKGPDRRSRQVSAHPAMLALIQAPDGQAVTLHRTYLSDAGKLSVADAKKVLSAGIQGAAVRLFDCDRELAISEGIETALAVHLATGKPVWAGISAGNLEKLVLPPSVQNVFVYADNDAGGDFAGEYHAYALARRLRREEKAGGPRRVRVFVPRHAGTDWADVWRERCQAQHDVPPAICTRR